MSELITRENAKQALCECCYMFKYIGDSYTECKYYPCDDIKALEAIPSAEAVQGVGRYEKAMQKLREMPRYLNGVKAKQINKIPSEAVQGETVQVIPAKTNNFKVDEIPDGWEPKNLGKDKRPRKKIYIAGPVTGVKGYEETFAKAADALRARGYDPVNPVAPGLVEGWTYRDYINRGFQMLMDCDGMLLLPGYMDSKGAALELHYALAVGMEIIKG